MSTCAKHNIVGVWKAGQSKDIPAVVGTHKLGLQNYNF